MRKKNLICEENVCLVLDNDIEVYPPENNKTDE